MDRPVWDTGFWDTGTVVSAGVHGALLVWLVVGNVFRAEPLPMEVQSVSVISSQEFAALTEPASAPDAARQVAVPMPRPDPAPAPAPPPDPEPAPQAAPAPPPAPAPPEDVAVQRPDVALPPPPAERVAPEAVPEPEPDAQVDEQRREAVTEDRAGEVDAAPQDATAPQEATTDIVTEADEQPRAPVSSARPPTRPTPPVRTAAPEPAPEPAPAAPSDPVADAIAEALANNATPPTPATPPTAPTAATAPSGPPLTGSEREGLRVAVSSCWNVGALSSEAQETKVTVFVAMNEDGTPRGDTIRMIGSSGGSAAAADRVFETARRAILRCGARGFPLPQDKYAQWREIEMTFDPEGMFWR